MRRNRRKGSAGNSNRSDSVTAATQDAGASVIFLRRQEAGYQRLGGQTRSRPARLSHQVHVQFLRHEFPSSSDVSGL